jgi:hypothetical protein
MNAHLWHAVGIFLLVVLTVPIYRAVRGRKGTTPQYVSSAIAAVAFFWAAWRWLFMLHTKFGPFRHLSFGYFLLVLLISALVVVLGRVGLRKVILRPVALIALILAVLAPFNWSLSSSLGRDYKAECSAQGLLVNSHGDGCEKKQTQVTPEAPAKTAAQCADGFNVAYDANAGNRVLSNGVNGTPTAVVNSVLAVAKHDTRDLQLYWNATPQGAASPVADYKGLESSGCYNDRGRAIYYQTLGAYQSAVKSSADAPNSGVNTGVTPKGSPFQEAPGTISGNRKATKVVFRNGMAVYILHRCGNIVSLTPIPHIPPKPRQPRPPTHPPTQPPTQPPTHLPCYSPGNGPTPVGSPAPGQEICPGKDPATGIENVPGVPPQTTGCGADGGNTKPCQGGTATNHPTQASPPPASGSTQCGVDGNAPCESPSPRPQPSSSPAPSGYPSAPPPGSGGAYPSSSPSPPPASGDPGGGSG